MTDKPKMDAATAEALEKSIAHWKENAEAERRGEVSFGPRACALCRNFWGNNCIGCPVSMATDLTGCRGSPYADAIDALLSWEPDPFNGAARDAFRTAALAEVAFLESLRDAP